MRHFILLVSTLLAISGCTMSESSIEKRAKKIHERALTVDSHVDTPMWLSREGYKFTERHDSKTHRNKVDLPRMKEGGLDGVFFAVFVGQGERSDEGNSRAAAEAQATVDSIYSMVGRNNNVLEIALDPDDFKLIERKGKRAIFLGMENGYPIGTDLALLDTFYNKGIRYITLCHSYNNDICDSSTDSTEHNGLSAFGRQVVKRMNELGIMIDMSHASDESFRQVIEISEKPIIASHSCAKALCENPRNLSDELLLKLKDNGGVIQMCILSAYVQAPQPNPERDSARNAVYEKHGNYYDLDDAGKEAFLIDWYKVDKDYPRKLATVSEVVDHIDHIVTVAGIDHVGIGTDFDGGGGVADCYDVSEIGNITAELIRRGYSEKEIRKIWSGNLMRVMKEVGSVN
ncbi:dipeptidase [Bacteroidota bacterium]